MDPDHQPTRALAVTGPEDLRARFAHHATDDLAAELARATARPGNQISYHTLLSRVGWAGPARCWEPRRLRLRIFTCAGRIVHSGHRLRLAADGPGPPRSPPRSPGCTS
jgi:hypothetical protein